MRARTLGFVLAVLIQCQPSVKAALLADSVAEFSGTQGLHHWRYGFYNLTGDVAPGYQSADFTPFDTFEPGNNRWVASAGQVGDNNNDFLSINDIGGHPNGIGPPPQNAQIWAVRRYTSEAAGPLDVIFDLRKVNVGNPSGNGMTGRIFLDGVEVYTEVVDNLDDIAQLQLLTLTVALGSQIDFAIDSRGTGPVNGDGIRSARADGSRFSAVIRHHVVDTPATPALFGLGLGLLTLVRRRTRDTAPRLAASGR